MEKVRKHRKQTLLTRVYGLVLGMIILGPVQAVGKSPAPSTIGLARESVGTGFLLQFIAGLLVVLFCVVGLAWLMKRFGRLQSSANGCLRIVGGMALSTRERIVLVQVGKTQVLLGVAPGRVQAVHVLDEPVAVGEKDSSDGAFAARLKDVLRMQKTT